MCVRNSHGQGTIEYLIVIAIVVVLSLVAIVDALADTKNNSVLALQNNSGEPIIISSISSDTNDNYFNQQIVQGDTKSFMLKNNPKTLFLILKILYTSLLLFHP